MINKYAIPIRHLALVAPTFPQQRFINDLTPYEWLIEAQELFYATQEDLKGVSELYEKVSIFISKDDPYIPYDHAWLYYSQIPGIELYSFEDKWHFNADAGIVEFPELLSVLDT